MHARSHTHARALGCGHWALETRGDYKDNEREWQLHFKPQKHQSYENDLVCVCVCVCVCREADESLLLLTLLISNIFFPFYHLTFFKAFPPMKCIDQQFPKYGACVCVYLRTYVCVCACLCVCVHLCVCVCALGVFKGSLNVWNRYCPVVVLAGGWITHWH